MEAASAGAFCLSDVNFSETSVAYKDVPLPSRTEVDAVLGDVPSLAQRVTIAGAVRRAQVIGNL